MSSNVGQNYPYTQEREEERARAVEGTFARFEGLRERVAAEASPLVDVPADERWWVWVCPTGSFGGRLHVAGYARDQHAVFALCDECGRTFLR